MVITFKIDGQSVECPQSWDDLSIRTVLALKGATNASEIFKALTGCDIEIPEFQLEREIFPFISFVADQPEFDKLPMPEYVKGHGAPLKNLGHGTFGQKITAQKIIAAAFKDKPESVDITSFMVDLLAVYMPGTDVNEEHTRKRIESYSFIQCYPVFNHYCKEIVRLVGRDKKYLDHKPDPTLTLAGIDKLSKFGEMRIIDSLADGDLAKYDQILKIEYDVIFKKLWYLSEQAALNERVRKIRERKAKQSGKA